MTWTSVTPAPCPAQDAHRDALAKGIQCHWHRPPDSDRDRASPGHDAPPATRSPSLSQRQPTSTAAWVGPSPPPQRPSLAASSLEIASASVASPVQPPENQVTSLLSEIAAVVLVVPPNNRPTIRANLKCHCPAIVKSAGTWTTTAWALRRRAC